MRVTGEIAAADFSLEEKLESPQGSRGLQLLEQLITGRLFCT